MSEPVVVKGDEVEAFPAVVGHVKLTNPPGPRWVDVVIAEIGSMVDHSEDEAEEGEPNWRGVTR